MGEIIIKVPEDVREVIETELPYEEIKKKIEELERERKLKFLLKFTEKYAGKIDVPEVKEEELYE